MQSKVSYELSVTRKSSLKISLPLRCPHAIVTTLSASVWRFRFPVEPSVVSAPVFLQFGFTTCNPQQSSTGTGTSQGNLLDAHFGAEGAVGGTKSTGNSDAGRAAAAAAGAGAGAAGGTKSSGKLESPRACEAAGTARVAFTAAACCVASAPIPAVFLRCRPDPACDGRCALLLGAPEPPGWPSPSSSESSHASSCSGGN